MCTAFTGGTGCILELLVYEEGFLSDDLIYYLHIPLKHLEKFELLSAWFPLKLSQAALASGDFSARHNRARVSMDLRWLPKATHVYESLMIHHVKEKAERNRVLELVSADLASATKRTKVLGTGLLALTDRNRSGRVGRFPQGDSLKQLRCQLCVFSRQTLQSNFTLRFGCIRGTRAVVRQAVKHGMLTEGQDYRLVCVLSCPDLLLRGM